tara:strand:+ start:151 stop:423 length:273 start_codon:yes stop_codon:yes gene_type:complete
MDKIENNQVIKINMTNIEQSANQIALRKLLNEKWRVVSCIPVDDNGTPTIVMILAPPIETLRVEFPMYPLIVDMITVIFLGSIFATLLFR